MDELDIVGSPLSNPDLIVKILSGARDTTVSYDELFEKLLDHELFLHHEDVKKLSSPLSVVVPKSDFNNRNTRKQNNNSQQRRHNSHPNAPPQCQSNYNPNIVIWCQLCNWVGHTTNVCYSKSYIFF